jgi:hypothetical protein
MQAIVIFTQSKEGGVSPNLVWTTATAKANSMTSGK